MKKVTSILFVILYLGLSIGVRGELHFCGDDLSGISFFSESIKCCCDDHPSKKKVKKDCCSDESFEIKYQASDQSFNAASVKIPQLDLIEGEEIYYNPLALGTLSNSEKANPSNGPPLQDLYKKYCSYLYYG